MWPVELLREGEFKIDMLFEYSNDGSSVLQWCQGEVIEFIKELDEKHVIVKIEWNENFLKKRRFNHHKTKIVEDKVGSRQAV